MTPRSERLLQKARQRLEQGEFVHAKTLATAALFDGPEIEILTVLASVHVRLGNHAAAEAVFHRAAALDPSSHKPHANLATLLGNQGRYTEAAEHARRASALSPEHPRFRVQLARWLVHAGRHAEAEQALGDLTVAPGAESLLDTLRASLAARRGSMASALAHLVAARHRGAAVTADSRLDELRYRWALHDDVAAAQLGAELRHDEPGRSAPMELDVLLSGDAASARGYALLHGRRRFLPHASSEPRAQPSAVVATVWGHGVDETASLRRFFDALEHQGRRVHVFAERPAFEEFVGLRISSLVDVSGWSHRQIAEAIQKVGATTFFDASGAGPSGRSAVWAYLEGVRGLRGARSLGVAAGFPLCSAPLRSAEPPGAPLASPARGADAPTVAALDLPFRWAPDEKRALLCCETSRILLRGHTEDLPAVRAKLSVRSAGIELRGSTTRPFDPSELAGVDLFVSPRAGSVAVALAVLSAGIPLVAFDGGDVAAVLRSSGLEALVLREGESPLSAHPRAIAALAAQFDAVGTNLSISPERACESFVTASSSSDAERPTASVEEAGADHVVELDGGLQIVVPDDLGNISTFVLLEQRRWFEDEVDFVDALLTPGDVVVDIGANHGAYALPMARRVGPAGQVRAFEPARETARRLRRSASLNGLDALRVDQCALGEHPGTATLAHGTSPELHQIGTGPGEQVEIRRLDDYRAELRGLSFVKLDAEGFEGPILRGGALLLESEQPLVMFELKHGSEIQHALIERFRELGFRSYSLVPALEALVPFDFEELDGFQLNLFAATDERAAELAARGRLFDGSLPSALAPDLAAATEWLQARPYARAFAAKPTPIIAWQLMAEDRRRTLGERRAAQLAALRLADTDPSRVGLTELLTRARVLRGAGRRGQALAYLAAAREQLSELLREPRLPMSPLLPVLARYEESQPDSPREWLEAQTLEASVRFQAYSSCFAGDEPIPWLLRLVDLPLGADEMLRRLSLILERRGMLD